MSDYKMSREEFRAELEELILAARPDVNIGTHDIRYHLEKLEDVLFGIRDGNDLPDSFSEYLGSL